MPTSEFTQLSGQTPLDLKIGSWFVFGLLIASVLFLVIRFCVNTQCFIREVFLM